MRRPPARSRPYSTGEWRSGSIVVTGNTIVDALHSIQRTAAFAAAPLPNGVDVSARIVLVTVHRRENWIHLPDVCDAIRQIVEQRPEVQVVLPVHPNPIVQQTLHRELGRVAGVVLLPALDYLSFLKVMSHSWIVLTDSGGVQEEAPVLGRPVLVMRDATERPEAIELGVARLVGTHRDAIVDAVLDPAERRPRAQRHGPRGQPIWRWPRRRANCRPARAAAAVDCRIRQPGRQPASRADGRGGETGMTRRKLFVFGLAAMSLSLVAAGIVVMGVDLYLHHRAERSAGLNRWGYRGPVVPAKAPGELRVVMLGGSTVFGYGGPWHESAPALLEQMLAAKHPGRAIRVINLGFNNEGAFAFLPTLQDYRYLDYDIVCLYEGYNDLMGDAGPNRAVFRHNSPVFRLTGYFPILPLVLQEKALVLRNGGNLEAGYRPENNKTVFRPWRRRAHVSHRARCRQRGG